MQKRLNPILGISLIWSFLSVSLIFQTNAQETSDFPKSMWASAKSGLRMRDAPNLNANKLKTIPYAQKVNVIQESGDILSLAKTQGKWTEVQWESNRGWVYGGFLSDLNPKLVDGDKMSELLNTLSELYSKK